MVNPICVRLMAHSLVMLVIELAKDGFLVSFEYFDVSGSQSLRLADDVWMATFSDTDTAPESGVSSSKGLAGFGAFESGSLRWPVLAAQPVPKPPVDAD
jgi:hypothetical protein